MQQSPILDQVLVGIALNRTPGFHFPVHLLAVSFDEVTDRGARLSIDPGPHCVDARGAMHRGALALQADLAMSAGIRAGLDPAQRLGTVSMSLHLTGVPARGRIEAQGWFEGMVSGAAGRQAQARFILRDGDTTIGFGGGSFMVLDPPPGVVLHPTPLRRRGDAGPPGLAPDDLTAEEQAKLDAKAAAVLNAIDEVDAPKEKTE
jgi:acyl-coenzyme A thioesterase PaaI-like protein